LWHKEYVWFCQALLKQGFITMQDNKVEGPMKNPPHPGQVLKGLYLEPLELTVPDAAKGLGITRKTLSQLVNGRHP